jgi:SAM-dependent methyltransferase
LGFFGRLRELRGLYAVHTGKVADYVRHVLKVARDIESTFERLSNIPLPDAAVLEIGAGQRPVQLCYFATRARLAVGIDTDVTPTRAGLSDYVQMWRRNGGLRIVKTVARRTLGMDHRFRKEVAKQLGVDRFPNPPILPMDASATTFGPETFDAIYSRAVFEHLSDPRGVLREIRRILKPGGAVVIFFHLYTSDSGCHDVRIFTGNREHIPYWSHLRPEHRHLINENTFLNRLRLSEWRALFSEELPGSVVHPHNDAYPATQNALRALRATGDLSTFSDEELLSVTVEVTWAKPLN